MMKTAKVAAVLFLSMLPIGAISMSLVACNNDDDEYAENTENSVTMRLIGITHSDGYSTESGMLTYDDVGRVIQFTWNGNSIKYSYNGSTVEAIYNWSSGSSSRTVFTLDRGVVVKKTLYGSNPEEYVYSYKNNQLSGIKMKKLEYTNSVYDFDYIWENNNLKQLDIFHNGKIDLKFIWKYNDIKTHPLIHALFGFYAYEDSGTSPYLIDLACVLPVYNNFGKLPTNLFSECTYYEENKSWNHTMSYRIDNGNIVEIIDDDGKRKEVYYLTWEKTSGIDNVKTDKAPGEVRTISGMNTGHRANDVKELPKGVYIVDGKKIVKSK